MREQGRINFRRIDPRNEQPAIQQGLARPARRTAKLDALVLLGDRQTAPGQRLGHLRVGPRHGVRRRPHWDRSARPALGRRHDAMKADPPLVRLDDHHVEHQGLARSGPALFSVAAHAILHSAAGAAARIAASISADERRYEKRRGFIVAHVCITLPNVHVAIRCFAGQLPHVARKRRQFVAGDFAQRDAMRPRQHPRSCGELSLVDWSVAGEFEREKPRPRKRRPPLRLGPRDLLLERGFRARPAGHEHKLGFGVRHIG